MSLKVYYIKTPDVSLAIDHEDSYGEDSIFQPDKGETLTFHMEGGERLEYGKSEYLEMVQKLKLPDLKGMNLDQWRKNFSTSPYLAKGEYTVANLSEDQIYIVGDHDCRLREMNGRLESIGTDSGIDEIVDKSCDGIADSAVTIYKNGSRNVHWEGNINTTADSALKKAVQKLADWAVENNERIRLQQKFRPKIENKERLEQAKGKVNLQTFFQSDSAEISPQELAKLDAFVEQNKSANEWLVEGYCDPIGSTEYNFDLGNRRARAVAEHLWKNPYTAKVNIRIVSYGENKSVGVTKNEKAKDRRVTLLPDVSPLLRALVLLENKEETTSKRHYLFDASGSMSEHKSDLMFYPYPSGSKIFSFNDCDGVHQLKNMSQYSIGDGTPLWISALQRIREMGQGEILTVVTDGMDTTDLSSELMFKEGIIVRHPTIVDIIRMPSKNKS